MTYSNLIRSFSNLIIVCIIFSASPVLSQNLAAPIPTDPQLIKGMLPNGLTYYIRPNHVPEHKVELRLVVKVGSILEDDDQQGLAHFMEHMNFNGTKNFPKNELVSYLESIGLKYGADLNANTGFDRTMYILSIPTDKPDNLEKGFQVLEDWAHNALLTDKDIDEERGVVLEESRLRKGAAKREEEQYFPLLVPGSRYVSRSPIGKDSIIEHVSHEALRRFYHDWYRPDLMAVMVIGDMDTASVLKMIQDHFNALTNPPAERKHFYADIPERTDPASLVIKDVEETRCALYLSYPYEKTKAEIAINDYRDRLKENMLLQLLRLRFRDLDKSGQQLGNIFFNTTMHGYRSLFFTMGFPNAGPENNLKVFTYALKQAATYGFYQSEIDLVKQYMMSANKRAYNEKDKSSSSSYIAEYVRNFMDGEQIEGLANERKLYTLLLPGIESNELTVLLREWIADENIVTYITAPESRESKLPGKRTLMDLVTQDLQQTTMPMKEKVIAASLLTEKPDGGKITDRKYDAYLAATTYTLSNGIKVTVKTTDFKNDEIRLSGVKKGGVCNYPDEDRINCHFASQLVPLMGYGSFTPNELSKQLSGKNITVSVRLDNNSDDISASSDVQNLESMMQLLYLKLTDARKDDEAYSNWKSNYKKQIDNIYAKPEVFFADTLATVKYNDNPLYVGIPAPEDLKELHLKRMLEIYRNEFSNADGYHFFMTGNIDTTVLIPLLETYLGSLPVSGIAATCTDNGLRPITGINKFTVHKGKENKSFILRLYYGDIAYSEETDRNMKAMAEILNIKVLQNLREKMSDIYTGGFSATISNYPYTHYDISLSLPCGPEHIEELLAAADKEVNEIKANGPSQEDLQKIKARWHEKHLLNLKDNAFWNAELRKLLYSHRKEDNFINYQSFIDNMTAADIQATAKQLFDGKNELTGILLPE